MDNALRAPAYGLCPHDRFNKRGRAFSFLVIEKQKQKAKKQA
jgi:hypothetical protein